MNKRPEIVIYSRAACSYCMAARHLLKSYGADWTEVSLDAEPGRRAEMIARSGRDTVPQIFVGEHHVGGFDDLQVLDEQGKLEQLLQKGTL